MANTYRVPSASLICILVTGCDSSIGVGAAVVRMLALVSCSFEWLNFTSGAGLKNNNKKNCPSSPSLLLVWCQCLYRLRAVSYFSEITNYELYKRKDSMNMSLEIKNRRLRWLGYALRLSSDKKPKVDLFMRVRLTLGLCSANVHRRSSRLV